MYTNTTENQAKSKKSLYLRDNQVLLNELSTKKRRFIIDTLFRFLLRYPNTNPKQITIALQSGCSRKLVNEVLGRLHNVLFIKEKRYYKRKEISCRYYLNPIFRELSVLQELAQYLPSLRRMISLFYTGFSIALLVSTHASKPFLDHIYQEKLHHNKKVLFIKKEIKNKEKKESNFAPIGAFLTRMGVSIPKKMERSMYELPDKPDYVKYPRSQVQEPQEVDRRKLFPVYEEPKIKERDYKADALYVMNWLNGTDPKDELGRQFLASLGEETITKLVTRHMAPTGNKVEEE